MLSDIYDLEIVRKEVFIEWRDSGKEASVKCFFDCHGLWLDGNYTITVSLYITCGGGIIFYYLHAYILAGIINT